MKKETRLKYYESAALFTDIWYKCVSCRLESVVLLFISNAGELESLYKCESCSHIQKVTLKEFKLYERTWKTQQTVPKKEDVDGRA